MRVLISSVCFVLTLISTWFLQEAMADPQVPVTGSQIDTATVLESRIGNADPLETLTIRSPTLGEDRQIYVQLPVGYSHSEQRYPVLFVMDAEWLFDLASAHVRYYSFDEVTDIKIPRMIVVGITNEDRDQNYTPTANSGKEEVIFPTAGKADEFLQFLEHELVPLLDNRYRTTTGRVIIGWSFSGLFSMYAAVERPHLFAGHLNISPAIWWDNDMIFKRMQKTNFDYPKRLIFTLGSNEAGGWVYTSTKRLLTQLEGHPVPKLLVSQMEFKDVGHTWGVAAAMDKGIQALFAGYIAPEDVINSGLDSVNLYYSDLSRQWGFKVSPPGKVLREVAVRKWAEGDHGIALEIMKTAVINDPVDSVSKNMLASMYRADGDSKKALQTFNAAIQAELLKPVPNKVNLRIYRTAIETTSIKESQ